MRCSAPRASARPRSRARAGYDPDTRSSTASPASPRGCRPSPDTEPVREPGLHLDPVLDGHDRKARAVRLAGLRIDRRRAGRAEAAAEVIHADHEEALGVERLARADHVVPPADVVRVVGVEPRDVVRRVQRVAHEHCIRARRIEPAIGLVEQAVLVDRRAALEPDRLGETHPPRRHRADRLRNDAFLVVHETKNPFSLHAAERVALALAELRPGRDRPGSRPQAEFKSAREESLWGSLARVKRAGEAARARSALLPLLAPVLAAARAREAVELGKVADDA